MAAPTRSARTTGTGGTEPAARGGRWPSVFDYWWRTYRRTWQGSIVTGFLSPLLYLVAMGFGLGSMVRQISVGDGVSVPFVMFVAPAVLAATAMQAAVGESTYSVMGAVKWQRQYHAMLATPLSVGEVLGGHLAYVTARVTITSAVYMVVAALLGTFGSWWVVLALPAAVLTGLAFAAPIFAFSAGQDADQGFNVLFRFGITPMFLFSGTFFPVEQLPGWLQPVAWATPLWHGVELCRGLSLATLDGAGAVLHVAYLLVWVVGGYAVARRVFARRLVD
ncbi:MAG: ABC transporter permease [Actinomycetes bacterium]